MAQAALYLWVPLSLLVFAIVKKPHRAVLGLLIAGAILLPERQVIPIKFLPDIDKKTIACAWVLIPMLLWHRRHMRGVKLGRAPWALLGLLVVVDVFRALTNMDTMTYRNLLIPELKFHTSVTFILEHILTVFTPFYLGATLFRDREHLRDLLKAFCVAGLLYVPLVAIELRLSPQMHIWIYGYLQHDWEQLLRGGGYRPMVFMEHGLALTLFLATAALCGAGLSRTKNRLWGVSYLPFAALLCVVVALCSSLGAIAFLLLLLPLLIFMPPKWHLRVATAMACLVIMYPLLRAGDLLPVRKLVDLVAAYKPDRAQSLDFRITNEIMALRHAQERPWFGWGGFDRIFVYSDEGPNVLDGAWIIAYAESGILGFLATFGLFFWPIWLAFKKLRKVQLKADKLLISTLAVVTAMNVMDLIPNGMFTYFPYLLAGALLGAVRQLSGPGAAQPLYSPMPHQPPLAAQARVVPATSAGKATRLY